MFILIFPGYALSLDGDRIIKIFDKHGLLRAQARSDIRDVEIEVKNHSDLYKIVLTRVDGIQPEIEAMEKSKGIFVFEKIHVGTWKIVAGEAIVTKVTMK
ncbi:MAG: hypothetical protein SGJ02_01195 [bacterium]|nr:hypothetical protein [bacterium]